MSTPVLIAQGTRAVHIFWISPTWISKSPIPAEIKHLFFDGQQWTAAPVVSAEKSRLRAMKAMYGRDGRIYLLWAETEILRSSPIPEERYFPPKLYLRTWADEAWTAAEEVSDSKAEPLIFENGMDLGVDSDGTVDAFWIDLREKSFIQGLLTMGHDEEVAKSFHRARVAGSWSDATRVQEKGGAFEVDDVTAIRDRSRGLHLFWSQTARSFRGESGIFHSEYLERGWLEPDKIGGPQKSFNGKPGFVSQLSAAAGPDNGLYVAWVSRRYPDRSRTDDTLEVLKLADGHWTKELLVRSGFITLSGR